MAYETILYEVDDDHVATVTLNRPDKLNSFNMAMRRDFRQLWRDIQDDDAVHAVVLRAAGDRAFSTGIDATERADMIARGVHMGAPPNPFVAEDPGITLAPKQNECWKPIVCAVHGMAAGGAFYWINESDIVIASDDATFFDPHVTYGMTSALEPVGLKWRIPLGEVLRWALMGLDERMSAERAHRDRTGLGGRRARPAVGASARDRRDRGGKADRGHARNGEGDLAVARSHEEREHRARDDVRADRQPGR